MQREIKYRKEEKEEANRRKERETISLGWTSGVYPLCHVRTEWDVLLQVC